MLEKIAFSTAINVGINCANSKFFKISKPKTVAIYSGIGSVASVLYEEAMPDFSFLAHTPKWAIDQYLALNPKLMFKLNAYLITGLAALVFARYATPIISGQLACELSGRSITTKEILKLSAILFAEFFVLGCAIGIAGGSPAEV